MRDDVEEADLREAVLVAVEWAVVVVEEEEEEEEEAEGKAISSRIGSQMQAGAAATAVATVVAAPVQVLTAVEEAAVIGVEGIAIDRSSSSISIRAARRDLACLVVRYRLQILTIVPPSTAYLVR
jgi:hypothetical protein